MNLQFSLYLVDVVSYILKSVIRVNFELYFDDYITHNEIKIISHSSTFL